jgi:predicted ABC-type sugar transport system permease subunit
VATQAAVIAIIAAGQTYVTISAEIELSIGSNIALSGMNCALSIQASVSVPIAMIFGLLSGAHAGSAVTVIRENDFKDQVVKKYPGSTIVRTQYSNGNKTKTLNITTGFMTANPDLAGFSVDNLLESRRD